MANLRLPPQSLRRSGSSAALAPSSLSMSDRSSGSPGSTPTMTCQPCSSSDQKTKGTKGDRHLFTNPCMPLDIDNPHCIKRLHR